MHGPSPTSNFGGTVPPVPPGLRPWCAAFGKMWREKCISIRTKMKLHYALVVPVLLHVYGSECVCLRKKDEKTVGGGDELAEENQRQE